MIMIFLKQFDTSKQSLFGLGKHYVQRNAKVGDLVPIINERMGWASGTPIKLYEVGFSLIACRSLKGIFWPGNQTRHD